eukprot:8058598-Ditylum_brightwellii.AAC.1
MEKSYCGRIFYYMAIIDGRNGDKVFRKVHSHIQRTHEPTTPKLMEHNQDDKAPDNMGSQLN